MCDASTRQVNFGAFLNFLPLADYLWFRVYTVVGQPKRSKNYALTSLGFKCFVGTPECLIRTRESYNKIRNRDAREKHTGKKKHTCRLASSIIPSGID